MLEAGPGLLLVALDDVRGSDLRAVGVLSELAPGLALAEQVVALVELDADRIEPFLLGGADATALPGLLPELFLLVSQPVDPIEDGFVRHVHAPFATCSSCEIGPSRYHVSSSPLPLTSTVPWCSKAKSSVSSS